MGLPGEAVGPSYLSTVQLEMLAGIKTAQIPYGGLSQALNDLIAEHVDMMFDEVPSVAPNVIAGQVRALGVTGKKRSPALPDVPTVAESVPGYEHTGWFGLMAPTGTPVACKPGIASGCTMVFMLAAGSLAAAAYFARKVLTPERQRPDDTDILHEYFIPHSQFVSFVDGMRKTEAAAQQRVCIVGALLVVEQRLALPRLEAQHA